MNTQDISVVDAWERAVHAWKIASVICSGWRRLGEQTDSAKMSPRELQLLQGQLSGGVRLQVYQAGRDLKTASQILVKAMPAMAKAIYMLEHALDLRITELIDLERAVDCLNWSILTNAEATLAQHINDL